MPLVLMRWFLCLCFGLISYLLLLYFYGSSGIYAQEALEVYYENLKVHVKELELNQNLLEEELASLYYSEEDLKLQARKLGYFEEQENIFYFSLPSSKQNFYREPSLPLFNAPYRLFSNSFFLLASSFATLIFYLSWGMLKDLFGSLDRFKPLLTKIRPWFKTLLKTIGRASRSKPKN